MYWLSILINCNGKGGGEGIGSGKKLGEGAG